MESNYRDIVQDLTETKETLVFTKSESLKLHESNVILEYELASLKTQQLQLTQQLEAYKSSSNTSAEDKRNLILLLDRRQQDLDLLNQDTNNLQSQNNQLRTELNETRTKNSVLEAECMNSKHLLESRDQELTQAVKQNEWLSNELNRKNEEFRIYRTEKVLFNTKYLIMNRTLSCLCCKLLLRQHQVKAILYI